MVKDTKSVIIDIATTLFQQRGYKDVGLNEILKACNISKGSFYHHFPDGKEALLITCLQFLNQTITDDMVDIFKRYPTTEEAINNMISKLIVQYETEGTITGYTFSSIVSEMASLSDPVRIACAQLYQNMQDIYVEKLVADGFSKDTAYSIALMMTASIEGGMMLCLTQGTSEPLKIISHTIPKLLKEF